jgi:hypothetical protein
MAATQSAALTLAEMIALAKVHLIDTDSGNPQFTDAQYTDDLNDEYGLWYQENNQRPAALTGANTFDAINVSTAGQAATSKTTKVLEFKRMYLESASGDFAVGPELEMTDIGLIAQLQQGDLTAGTPKVAAVYKQQSASASSIGTWGLYLWPIPSGTVYVSALATIAPYKLDSTVTTDRFDVTEAESRTIVARRAYRMASRNGRDESVLNAIAATLPADQQALLGRKVAQESKV